MYLSTYIVNDTRKEYTYTGLNIPEEVSKKLVKMESEYQWDLRKDYIYIWHTSLEKISKYKLKYMEDIK